MDENIRDIIIELDTLKSRRHYLRCKLINFLKKNYKSFPDRRLPRKILYKNIGNICDKKLVKDCLVIYQEINNQ